MEDSQYFVQIKDPTDMRRSILGSSRQIIEILQRYEKIKALRIKKLEAISRLREQNKEINLIIAKMKKSFPKSGLRVKIKEQTIPNRKGETSGDDLLKLESELKMIEEKLSGL